MPKGSYPISTSADEVRRLDMQAALFRADAAAMLERIDVRPGWRALDLCCGIGGITDLLSAKVGPTGAVVGADVDAAKLAYAREWTARQKLDNVEFVEVDAFRTGLPERSFDLVHCRFALSVIPDGRAILDQMLTLVRPGGVVAVEEANIRTMQCVPDNKDWRRAVKLLHETFAANGADVELGPKLYAIFQTKGLRDIDVRPCLHALTAADPMTMHVPSTLAAMRDNILSLGRIEADALDHLIQRLYTHLSKPETLTISFAMVQVTARAPEVSPARSGPSARE